MRQQLLVDERVQARCFSGNIRAGPNSKAFTKGGVCRSLYVLGNFGLQLILTLGFHPLCMLLQEFNRFAQKQTVANLCCGLNNVYAGQIALGTDNK